MKAILRRTTSRPASTDHSEQNYTENISKSLQFAGVELHSGRQQAYYQGCDLDLTGTEFALLQMLMRNSGEILSRELLSLKILGKNLTPYDRAIDMHISNLRKKLPEREDGLPWFKTLRGRGYLLVTEECLLLIVEDGHLFLTVEDDGEGVPENEYENILKPFYRVDEARARETGGTGLGLAIVQNVVKQHQGTIHLDKSNMGGLKIELKLPLWRS
ncbi:hypothetical protein Mh1950_19970 [Mannheimia haemolytica]